MEDMFCIWMKEGPLGMIGRTACVQDFQSLYGRKHVCESLLEQSLVEQTSWLREVLADLVQCVPDCATVL